MVKCTYDSNNSNRYSGLTGTEAIEKKDALYLRDLMWLLLILPSLDGNIFSLSAKGELENFLFFITLGLTIISGPGSWACAAGLSATLPENAMVYVCIGGTLGTIFALVAATAGIHFRGKKIPEEKRRELMKIFGHMASVIVLISAIIKAI